jgi:GTP cyclohydrolase I
VADLAGLVLPPNLPTSTLGTALFHEPIVHHGGEGVVLVRDIDFASTSEETLLPFHGRCHVAYKPQDGVVLGLSKLARLVRQFGKRLQTQERLAAEISLALQGSLDCQGVAVVLEARHLRHAPDPELRTSASISGIFAATDSLEFEVRLR